MMTLDLEWFFTKVSNIIDPYYPDIYERGLYFKNKRFKITNTEHLFYSGNGQLVDLDQDLPKDISLGDIVDMDHVLIATRIQINNGYVNTKPYLQITPAKILVDFLDVWQVIQNPDRHLYFEDELGMTNDVNLLTIDKFIAHPEDVVDMLELPDVVSDKVKSLYQDIYSEHISYFMDKDIHGYYKFNIDTSVISIIKHSNLKSTRYELAVKERKNLIAYEKSINDEHRTDIHELDVCDKTMV